MTTNLLLAVRGEGGVAAAAAGRARRGAGGMALHGRQKLQRVIHGNTRGCKRDLFRSHVETQLHGRVQTGHIAARRRIHMRKRALSCEESKRALHKVPVCKRALVANGA